MPKPFITSSCWLVAWLAELLCACIAPEPEEQFGLEAVYLYVSSEDLARLQLGTFSKTSASVALQLEGQLGTGRLSIAGESTVDDVKKSFNVVLDQSIGGRTRWRLDAMSRDASALKAVLGYRVFARAGFDVPSPRYAAVFLNGDYLGLYTVHERIDEAFLAAHGQIAVRIYAAQKTLADMESTAHVDRAFASRVGDDTYADLKKLIAVVNEPPSANGRRVLERYLDVDSVLRYMAVTAYIDNSDGVNNNFTLIRTKKDARFAILPWDLDFSFQRTWSPDDGELFEQNAMMRRLFEDKGYRMRYTCFLGELMVNAPPELLAVDIDTLRAKIEQAHRADPALRLDQTPLADLLKAILARNDAQQVQMDDLACGADDLSEQYPVHMIEAPRGYDVIE